MINFKVDLSELNDLIERLEKKENELSPLLERIADTMMRAVRENFAREGRPEKWTPLSPLTIEDRIRKGFWPGKILHRTGRLLDSIEARIDADSVELSTDLPYAKILHEGGGAIPPRPFLSLTDDDVEEIMELVGKWLDE